MHTYRTYVYACTIVYSASPLAHVYCITYEWLYSIAVILKSKLHNEFGVDSEQLILFSQYEAVEQI